MRKKNLWMQALLLAGLLAAASTSVLYAESVEEETENISDTAEKISLDAFADEDFDAFWMIDQEDQYVTLGDLDSLELIKYHFTVGDSDVENEITDRMYSYSYLEDTETADFGDVVTMDLTTTLDGEESTDEDLILDVGYGELSDGLDSNLEGCKVGDEISFSEEFDEDTAPYDEWIDKTVDFKAVIKSVQTSVIPDVTEEWVKENTDFASIDEYKAAVKEELQTYYDKESENDVLQSAIGAALERCTFNGYPQDLYDKAYEGTVAQYEALAEMWDISLEELYESYGMDENVLNESTQEFVNYQLFLSAYSRSKDFHVSYEEFCDFLNSNYEAYGYADASEMLSDYGVGDVAFAILEEKVSAALAENAKITVEEYDSNEDAYMWDDSSALDILGEEDWEDESEGDFELYELDDSDAGLIE